MGHEVIGVFMRHGRQSPVACAAPSAAPERQSPDLLPVVERLDHKQGCCTAADAEDARRVEYDEDRELAQLIRKAAKLKGENMLSSR